MRTFACLCLFLVGCAGRPSMPATKAQPIQPPPRETKAAPQDTKQEPRFASVAEVRQAILGLSQAEVRKELGAPVEVIPSLQRGDLTTAWTYHVAGVGRVTVWFRDGGVASEVN